MYKIEAIVRPYLVDPVRDALQQIGVLGLTVMDCRGSGQPDLAHRFRGSQYAHGLVPRALILVVVDEEQLEESVNAIREAAETGEVGDGKILITKLHDVVRIRTNERGSAALS